MVEAAVPSLNSAPEFAGSAALGGLDHFFESVKWGEVLGWS